MKHACVFTLRGEEPHPLKIFCLHMFELFLLLFVYLFLLLLFLLFLPLFLDYLLWKYSSCFGSYFQSWWKIRLLIACCVYVRFTEGHVPNYRLVKMSFVTPSPPWKRHVLMPTTRWKVTILLLIYCTWEFVRTREKCGEVRHAAEDRSY